MVGDYGLTICGWMRRPSAWSAKASAPSQACSYQLCSRRASMPRLRFSTVILCCTMVAVVGSVGSARADAASDRQLRTRMEA
jgi:hypothetical protein